MAELPSDEEGGTLIARKVGEAVQNTLGAVVTAMDIPLGEFCSVLMRFFWSKGFFVFKEQNLLLNFKSLCDRLEPLLWYHCWLRVLQPSGSFLLDVSSWFSARCFCRSHFLFSPYYAKLCTKLWVIHVPLMDSLQWPAIWSSLKIGQIGNILSGLVFFQRCWVPFKCVHGYCWYFLVLLRGRAENLKLSRLVMMRKP